MILTLLKPDEGSVSIEGVNVNDDPLKTKRMISFVPDNPDIYESITGRQYINFIVDVYGVDRKLANERMIELADLFEISNDLDNLIGTYSHGMKQKICLIGALVNDPKVLILDEPLVGLDPKSAFNLKNLLKEHAQKGNYIFFSTHVLDVAENLCDVVTIINKGELIVSGTIEEIKSSHGQRLEELFLELTK